MPEEKERAFWDYANKMGSSIVGGMAGVGAAITTSNIAVGVATNVFISRTLEMVGNHLFATRMATRQTARVGRALTVTATRLGERVSAGEIVRSDAFVRPDLSGRSPADEVTEAALVAAMNSSEEKKIDFLGALLTSVALDSQITAANAQLMVETARTISFRGMVIVEIASKSQSFNWPQRSSDQVAGPEHVLYPLMVELHAMTQRGLIYFKEPGQDQSLDAVFGPDDVDPSRMFLTPFGAGLHAHLELSKIPEDDETYVETVRGLGALAHSGRGSPRHADATAVWG